MAGKRSEIRGSAKATLLGILAGRLIQVWSTTLRIEIVDRCGITKPGGVDRPVIYCLWHGNVFTLPDAWRRACGGHRRAVVLASASHDGATLARAVSIFGIGAIRGSSSRRGVAALIGLRKSLRENFDTCITPDGPRGPRLVVQQGIIKLAETSGALIVPIHVDYASCRRLNSWDRFAIPAPGSRVRITFDEALAVPAGLSEDESERWRQRLEETMNRNTTEPF